MKIAIFFLAFTVGLVYSETCGSNPDSCHAEVCGTGQVPTCDSHICTCINRPDSIGDCKTKHDCDAYFRVHHCRDVDEHCYDQKCKCLRTH